MQLALLSMSAIAIMSEMSLTQQKYFKLSQNKHELVSFKYNFSCPIILWNNFDTLHTDIPKFHISYNEAVSTALVIYPYDCKLPVVTLFYIILMMVYHIRKINIWPLFNAPFFSKLKLKWRSPTSGNRVGRTFYNLGQTLVARDV